VLVTISDRKKGIADPLNAALIKFFEPVMLSGTDYYPFGMAMRVGGESKYKYGYNGQEMSNEIKGEGNSYTAEFWEYDPRLGRRWNMDPVYKHSPYETYGGNPIAFADPNGADTINITRTTTRQRFRSSGGGLDGIPAKQIPDKISSAYDLSIVEAKGDDIFRITDVSITIDEDGNQSASSSTTTFELNNKQTFYRTGGHNMKGYNDDRYALAANTPAWVLQYYANKSGDIGVKSALAYQKDVPFANFLQSATNVAYSFSGAYGLFRFTLSGLASRAAAGSAGKLVGFGSDDAIVGNTASLIPKRGWYDVVVHGTEDGLGFTMNGTPISPLQLYN
jgi:RHS repeat-associated protein